MKKHILFLGAPGAGKGTQAALISKANSYLHLSTGELLRKEIETNTNLGRQVKDIINRGELVSDELVLKIVRQNLDKDIKGWILDGYPRNLSQANALNEVLCGLHESLYMSNEKRYNTNSGELGYPNEMVRGCLRVGLGVDGIPIAEEIEMMGIKTPETLEKIREILG